MSPALLPFLFRRLAPPQKVLVVMAALIALGLAVNAVLPHPAEPARAAVANPHTVWRICQERVSAGLKAPASAEFPSYDERSIHQSGALWTVNSYVDAQNSFGAQLRTRYTCTASFHPDGATYDIESITVG
jgi:hypothetical protein